MKKNEIKKRVKFDIAEYVSAYRNIMVENSILCCLENLQLRLHRGVGRDCAAVNELHLVNFYRVENMWTADQTCRAGVEIQQRENNQFSQ